MKYTPIPPTEVAEDGTVKVNFAADAYNEQFLYTQRLEDEEKLEELADERMYRMTEEEE